MASKSITETLSGVTLEPTLHMKLGTGNQQIRGRNNNNAPMGKSLKLDPTRALEPAKKKLSTIETQRIMAVFEDGIKRAEVVTALPYIMANLERFRVSLGSELYEVIKQHHTIQESYKDIRTSLDDLLDKRAQFMIPHDIQVTLGDASQTSRSNLFSEDGSFVEEEEAEEEEGEEKEDKAQTENNSNESNVNASLVEKTSSHVEKMAAGGELEPRIEECMRNLGLVAQQMSHSCKIILRQFALNPAASKLLNTEERLRTEGSQSVINSLYELKEILLHKLLTSPQEEIQRLSYLDDISKKERHNAAIIYRQEAELRVAIEDKEEEIRKKNDVIKRLQTDLHQIEKFSDENIRRLRAEAEKQEIADSKSSDQKIQKLQAEINQLQTQLNNSIAEHRDLEADLRGKKYKVENEVDNWIQKYDQDLGERQDEYEEIDLVYTEEKKQLLELEERFATLEKEYLTIMEERRLARDKRDRAQRELALLVKSATTIQAFWRSYKVRKALKAKSKKKGKKGKK